jgi:hypothetical protein
MTQIIKAGQWIAGYQVQAQAPVSYIAGSKKIEWAGHLINGSYSNPWWAFNPDTQTWAVVKVLKVKAQTVFDWVAGDPDAPAWPYNGHTVTSEVPASVQIVLTPVNAAGEVLPDEVPSGYALAA